MYTASTGWSAGMGGSPGYSRVVPRAPTRPPLGDRSPLVPRNEPGLELLAPDSHLHPMSTSGIDTHPPGDFTSGGDSYRRGFHGHPIGHLEANLAFQQPRVPDVGLDQCRLSGFEWSGRESQIQLRHDQHDRNQQHDHRDQGASHVAERVAEDASLQLQHDADIAVEQSDANEITADPFSHLSESCPGQRPCRRSTPSLHR